MSGLITHPIDLMLAIVEWSTHTRLPGSQAEVYDHWLNRALRPNDYTEDLMSADQLGSALGQIAWAVYQEQRLDVGLDEIEQAIGAALSAPTVESQASMASAPAAANNAARAIADKSGLFIPFGEDAYAFAHRRLSAYLAAYHAVHASLALDKH